MPENDFAGSRKTLFRELERTVHDPKVLEVMRAVPRERFIPRELQEYAYDNRPLPIGQEQTISQPFIVAAMSSHLQLTKGHKVLEIGTGSGYQAAVLGELAGEVFSIEIIESHAVKARELLHELGFTNIHVRSGDGYRGWREHAPFDRIILTAACPRIPEPLIAQLAIGGRLIAPLGKDSQTLILGVKTEQGFFTEEILPVRFVPMTGEVEVGVH
ncbi:MAG: protein-L-isoaspartate(D-aspartate) O-methyltransferase [Bdellovibrionales bacterium]|nr:protein-L-isoaspartate(D-aspartate) O-methyltransferase [Bdellovibrionales bacterium]